MKRFASIGVIVSANDNTSLIELCKKHDVFLTQEHSLLNSIDVVSKINPDFLLLDINFEGIDVMLKTYKQIIPTDCVIKYISVNNEELYKNITGFLPQSEYCDFVFQMTTKKYIEQVNEPTLSKDIIFSTLLDLGFSCKESGFKYVKNIIELCSQNGGIVSNFNIYIYPQIARKYHKTIYSVERSTSRAIENAYNTSEKQVWQSILKSNTLLKYKPTTKEFIYLVLENLMEQKSICKKKMN